MMLKGWVGCRHLCPQCAFLSLVYLSHLCGCLFKFLYIYQGFDFYMFLKVLKQVWHLSGLPLHLSLSHKLAGFWLACGECHKRLYGVSTTPHSYLHLSTKRTITTHGHGVYTSTISAPFFFKLFIFLWLCLCPHLWIANGSSRVIDWGWKFIWQCRFCIHIFVPSLTWKITAPCSSR